MSAANRTGHGIAQQIESMKFQSGFQTRLLCPVEIYPLNTGGLSSIHGCCDAVLGVSKVAAGFLCNTVDAGVENGLPVPIQRSARRRHWIRPIKRKVIKVSRHALVPEGNRMIE